MRLLTQYVLLFAIAIGSWSCETHAESGANSFRAEDYNTALFHFDQAYKMSPNDLSIIYNLARTHEELENYEDAILFYNKYLYSSLEPFPGYLGRARCYFGQEYYEGAELDFTNALRINDSSKEALYMRGRTRIVMQNAMEGIEDLNRAIELDDTHVRARYYRGLGLASVGSYGAAIGDFTFVINNEPDIIEAYYNRAFCYEQRFRFQRALEDYDIAIDKKPDYVNALTKRGIILLRLGREESACEDLKMLNKLKDKQGIAMYKRYCLGIAT